MRSRDIVRAIMLTIVPAGLALLSTGCFWRHHHRSDVCRNPAKVIGADSGGMQGGWVLVRAELPVADAADRIAAAFHVRTQTLTYLHGFSVYPVPQGSKFLCDKAVLEVHYDPVQNVPAH